MFCSITSCQNIYYQVHKVKGEKGETVVEAIYQLVKKKLKQYLARSKIVVYNSSVEQTIKIKEALRCPIYYCSVNN
jgi:hypothetical protein